MADVLGVRSSVATPIVVRGRLWGTLVATGNQPDPLPRDTEERLFKFTELVATAIANTESRTALAASEARARDLAGEQAALRRVATLVAEGVSSDELFAAVAREVAGVIDVPLVALQRYEPDRTFTMVGIAGETSFTVGSRWPVEDEGLAGRILATGRPARKQDYAAMPGPLGAAVREDGMISTVGVPIVVEGSIWGFITGAARPGKPIPDGIEERLARFTELVATAIADTQAREQLAQLAYEQAALRRVATLVARGVTPEKIFSAVTNEMAQLFGSPQACVGRFEPDGSAMIVVGVSDGSRGFPIGSRWQLEDYMASTGVYRTGRPVRVERSDLEHVSGPMADMLREIGAVSNVGAPIVVEGKRWGFVTVTDVNKRLPAGAEQRLEKFAELVATAIANAESGAALAASEARARELAEEQASLRRVATLVAEGAKSEAVFSAVAHEVAHVFGVQHVTVCRYEPDSILVLSSFEPAAAPPPFPAGRRLPLDVPSLPATVHRTGKPARIDDFTAPHGPYVAARQAGFTAAVGVPIVVDGTVWGAVNIASTRNERLLPDAEERLARFTQLVATSVSNATMRQELAASRARVIAASDETRRRIERDLHDGAQQRLVTLGVALRRAEGKIPVGLDTLRSEVTRISEGLTTAVEDVRELSRGIHPSILTEGGLAPALKALGRRSAVRVKLEMGFEHRLPDQVEVAAYYTVSEALTNASKHANATRVWVSLRIDHDTLRLSIRDDGVGGADANRGSGLTGLRDRIEALGGKIQIESPSGSGTLIEGEIPIAGPADRNPEPDELPAQATTPAPSG
jgi:signal transduction histidine kinase